ncbi:amidohydrolase family protein [Paralcaligenes sp. KSB-10]|uniref:amidohydrolase family protein n=1 Tax=Paralcaligenes sp. KSB-10 TaxID=2901142 RepID=UPI001E2F7290|nr:amidohydrolase family protein [Paralcaligenes sp. KSB-10]UHL64663.1 amidohydrolase family protein [Paralcaligenes sp. KSB-10]
MSFSSLPLEAPLVDTHAHLYTLDMPLNANAWHKPPRDATVEHYLSVLDTHGVQFAVLAAASIYGDYNDYHIRACRRHARLRTTIIAHPQLDMYTLERMKADGVVGIRLQWRNVEERPDLTSVEYQRLLRRVADLNWHVHVHDDSHRLPETIRLLEQAGVRLVIDHFGRPNEQHGLAAPGFQAVLQSVDRGNTWVKLSAGFRLPSENFARECAAELLKSAGPERLLWGSDWPFAAFENRVSYADTISAFTRWIPDKHARRKIAGETALKLYFS